MEVGLSPADFLCSMGTQPPPQKGDRAPKFSAYVYCGQTAGWIKMALGTEVGLSPGDFVLDGDPDPSPKRGRSPSPIFDKFLLCPNGWMDQDGTWHGGRPQPSGLCVRWGPGPSQKRGRSPLPNFRHMSVVAKWLDESRWHLAWRWDLVQSTLCCMGNQLPSFQRG